MDLKLDEFEKNENEEILEFLNESSDKVFEGFDAMLSEFEEGISIADVSAIQEEEGKKPVEKPLIKRRARKNATLEDLKQFHAKSVADEKANKKIYRDMEGISMEDVDVLNYTHGKTAKLDDDGNIVRDENGRIVYVDVKDNYDNFWKFAKGEEKEKEKEIDEELRKKYPNYTDEEIEHLQSVEAAKKKKVQADMLDRAQKKLENGQELSEEEVTVLQSAGKLTEVIGDMSKKNLFRLTKQVGKKLSLIKRGIPVEFTKEEQAFVALNENFVLTDDEAELAAMSGDGVNDLRSKKKKEKAMKLSLKLLGTKLEEEAEDSEEKDEIAELLEMDENDAAEPGSSDIADFNALMDTAALGLTLAPTISELSKIEIPDSETIGILLEDYLEELQNNHVVTLVKELAGKSDGTPAIDFLKKYLSGGIKGDYVIPDGQEIPGFSLPYEQAKQEELEAQFKASPKIMLMFPLFPPFLNASVSVVPRVSFGFKTGMRMGMGHSEKKYDEAKKDYRKQLVEEVKAGKKVDKEFAKQVFENNYSGMNLSFEPYVSGNVEAGVSLSAGLDAGAGIIFCFEVALAADLAGKADLEGSMKFEIDADARRGISRMMSGSNFGMGLKGNAELGGTLDFKGGLKSALIGWESNIFKYNLFKASVGAGFNTGFTIGKEGGILGNFSKDTAKGFSSGLADVINPSTLKVSKDTAPSGLDLMLKDAENTIKDNEVFQKNIEQFLENARSSKEGFAFSPAAPGASFIRFKETLSEYIEEMKKRNDDIKERMEGFGVLASGFDNNSDIKKKTEKLFNKMLLHQNRKNTMASYGINDAGNGMSPLEFYKKNVNSRAAGLKKSQNEKMKKSIIEKMAAKKGTDGTAAYKRVLLEKVNKETENKKDIIRKIENFDLANMEGEDLQGNVKQYSSFREYYEALCPNSKLLDHLGIAMAGEDNLSKDLKKFHQDRLAEKYVKNGENMMSIVAYKEKHNLGDNEHDREFTKWYFGNRNYKAYNVFNKFNYLPLDYMTPRFVIGFLKRRVAGARDSHGTNMFSRLAKLQEFKKVYDDLMANMPELNTPDEKEGLLSAAESVTKQARAFFFSAPDREKEFAKNIRRVATKEEILGYERKKAAAASKKARSGDEQRRQTALDSIKAKQEIKKGSKAEINTLAGLTDLPKDKKALLVKQMKELGFASSDGKVDLTQFEFWRTKKESVHLDRMKRGIDYISNGLKVLSTDKSSVGLSRDLVRANISLETIEQYESERASTKGKKTKGEKEEASRHKIILKAFQQRKKAIEGYRVEQKKGEKKLTPQELREREVNEKKAMVAQLRSDYFAGTIDKNAGVKSSYHLDLVKEVISGKRQDFNVIQAFLEKDINSYQGLHKRRVAELEALLKKNPNMSDAEFYYKYNQIRDYNMIKSGMDHGFDKNMRGEVTKDNVSIQHMLNYEERLLMNNTRSGQKGGYFVTKHLSKVNNIVPGKEYDEEKANEAYALYEQGVFGLYKKAESIYNNMDRAGIDEETVIQKFAAEFRKSFLSTDFMSARRFFGEMFNEMSPVEAVEYENRLGLDMAKEESEAHDLVSSFGDVVTADDMKRYKQLSQKQHNIKSAFSSDKDYMTDFDKYLKEKYTKKKDGSDEYEMDITPQMAVNYQRERIMETAGQYGKLDYIVQTIDEDNEDELAALREKNADPSVIESKAAELEKKSLDAFLANGGYDLFNDMSGGAINKIMSGANVDGIDGAEISKEFFSKDAIVDYEEERISHYREILAELSKPRQDITSAIMNLSKTNNWYDKKIDELSNLDPQAFFGNPKESDKMIKEIVAEDSGKKEAKKLEVIAEALAEAEEEAE